MSANQSSTGATIGCLSGIAAGFFLSFISESWFEPESFIGSNWGVRFLLFVFGAAVIWFVATLVESIYRSTVVAPRTRRKLPELLEEEEQSHLDNVKQEIKQVKARLDNSVDLTEKQFIEAFIRTCEASTLMDLYRRRKTDFENRKDFKNDMVQRCWQENNDKIDAIENEISKDALDLSNSISTSILDSYKNICQAFEGLRKCQKIWVIKSSVANTIRKSSASTVVDKEETSLPQPSNFMFVKVGDMNIPLFNGAKGETIYIYPNAVIVDFGIGDFTVLPLSSVSVESSWDRFIEDLSSYPVDSEFLCETWTYVNKNGGPDGRYSYNPKKAVVRYSTLTISPCGIKLQFSNHKAVDEFEHAFNALKLSVKASRYHNDSTNAAIAKQLDNKDSNTVHDEYFDMSKNQAMGLYSFIVELENDKSFIQFLEEMVSGLDELEKRLPPFKNNTKLSGAVLIDLIKCHKQLGHPISLSSKESICLNHIYGLLSGEKESDSIDVGQPSDTYAKTCDTLASASSTVLEKPHGFILAEILHAFDEDLAREYMTHLYRFSTIVAKADCSISNSEATWLASLLQFVSKAGKNEDKPRSVFGIHDEDTLLWEAANYILEQGTASTSAIQRRFAIGYNRAGKIMDQLELAAIVGPANGFGRRQIIATENEIKRIFEANMKQRNVDLLLQVK